MQTLQATGLLAVVLPVAVLTLISQRWGSSACAAVAVGAVTVTGAATARVDCTKLSQKIQEGGPAALGQAGDAPKKKRRAAASFSGSPRRYSEAGL